MFRKESVANQLIFLTGATSGVGEQLAYLLAKKQARLILSGRNQTKLAEVKANCREYTLQPIYTACLDLTQPKTIQPTMEQVYENYGVPSILINCAGIGLFRSFVDMDFEQVEQIYQINLFGTMALTKTVTKEMIQSKQSGIVVNIASQGGKMPSPKSSIYGSSKAALIAFSDTLRLELAPYNIQVLTVNPGPIVTNFFEQADETGNYLEAVKDYALEPEEVAIEIVEGIEFRKREVNLPSYMQLANLGYRLFPRVGDYLSQTVFNKK